MNTDQLDAPKINPWTPREDSRLRRMAKNKRSYTYIAAKLGRTPGATRQRALIIKVRFCSMGKAHSRAQKRRYVK